MISNHLSRIEELRPASNELAAQVEQYLAAGGKIDTSGSLSPSLKFSPASSSHQPFTGQR